MRYFKVLVKPGTSIPFPARVMEASTQRVLLRGDEVVPAGMGCDLQVFIPSTDPRKPADSDEIKVVVSTVIFAEGFIHLECNIKSIGRKLRPLVDA